jgi:Ni/Co efflux regulator RcnB
MKRILIAFVLASPFAFADGAIAADPQATLDPYAAEMEKVDDSDVAMPAPQQLDYQDEGLPTPRFGYYYTVEDGNVVLVDEDTGEVEEIIHPVS